ncbi:hypothetical protein ES705_23725 [subsurface metagenome]
MEVIYHPETETVEVPVELVERLDRRLARMQKLLEILVLLIEAMKDEELARRWRLLWSAN